VWYTVAVVVVRRSGGRGTNGRPFGFGVWWRDDAVLRGEYYVFFIEEERCRLLNTILLKILFINLGVIIHRHAAGILRIIG